QEQREKERREKEEEHRRWGEAIKRRNEALKRRSFWQKILWGSGDPVNSDAGLSDPGFLWCCWNLIMMLFGLGCSAGIIMIVINMIIAVMIPDLSRRQSYLLDMHDFLRVSTLL